MKSSLCQTIVVFKRCQIHANETEEIASLGAARTFCREGASCCFLLCLIGLIHQAYSTGPHFLTLLFVPGMLCIGQCFAKLVGQPVHRQCSAVGYNLPFVVAQEALFANFYSKPSFLVLMILICRVRVVKYKANIFHSLFNYVQIDMWWSRELQ